MSERSGGTHQKTCKSAAAERAREKELKINPPVSIVIRELVNADAFSRCRGNAPSRGKSEPRVDSSERERAYTHMLCFHYDVCAVPVVDIKNMNVETSRGPFSESAPAKGVIFVGPRGAPVVSIIRWIDIHIGSCSARNTPLVGGNAPSAERDKRGRRQLGNAASAAPKRAP
jgi:hypothetical protein